jgi:hypothetical protein
MHSLCPLLFFITFDGLSYNSSQSEAERIIMALHDMVAHADFFLLLTGNSPF